ncbi:DinB family protein [Deinococcus pimensis]|uniref:DinB family protein n=1 Tax=Deinococcus pimensis TaxID=309888 RepID=UPI0004838FBC|nr:DinB family protein [Deinococcus pimensis]
MQTREFYAYLTRARRVLWAALRAVPEEDLSRAVIPSDGARCVKDLVVHVAVVEDGWVHGDLLREPFVAQTLGRPEPRSADEYWHHETEPLKDLLAYWEADESRPETFSPDEVLWHVMQHEVRHTAQIVLTLLMLGHTPPRPDLAFFAAR